MKFIQRFLITPFVMGILLVTLSLPASAVVKAGASCSKLGNTSVVAGKKYTCVKSGKKLVWNKGVAIAKPKPTPSPVPTSTPSPVSNSPQNPISTGKMTLEEANKQRISLDPLSGKSCSKDGERIPNEQGFLICMSLNNGPLTWHQSFTFAPPANPVTPIPTPKESTEKDNYQTRVEDLSSCQLKEKQNFSGAGSKGFPLQSYMPATGKVKIAIIPVDFQSAPGQFDPGKAFEDDLLEIPRWGEFFSRGKLKYEAKLASPSWLRAPKDADWYVCLQCQKGAKMEKQSQAVALQELITLADSQFDFSNTNFVYFVFPEEAEAKFGSSMYGRNMPISTNEGTQTVSIYGEMGGSVVKTDRTKIWDHLIHEILHYQGFIGHGPINGADLGIMQQQWGASKAVTSWEAFLVGWFGKSEIVCIDSKSISENLYVTLSSIDTFGSEPVSLMIKLSEDELIVIEKRQNGVFTDFSKSQSFKDLNNFTAYVVNVNKASYRNDTDPNAESKNFWFYLRENQSIGLVNGVTYQGITLTPVSSNQIKITKSS